MQMRHDRKEARRRRRFRHARGLGWERLTAGTGRLHAGKPAVTPPGDHLPHRPQ
jgi:hypothetical protein